MKCVLLSGGGGLRLWPLSRKHYPKQFLKLGDDNTMFAKAILRNINYFEAFTVVTNESYRYMTENELLNFPDTPFSILLESIGRNTAPAIAITALLSAPDEICFVAPTDAIIDDFTEYHKAIDLALALAEDGNIVTFGIEPSSPKSEYGYIHHNGTDVISFKEKPDRATAEEYLKTGNYLWNSGMFMFKNSVLIDELQKYRPDIVDACKSLVNDLDTTENTIKLSVEGMQAIPAESIDYAVIEKSDKVKVVPSNFYWNDMGGLEALNEMNQNDADNNRLRGDNIIISDCKNTGVINEAENSLVVVHDVEDLLVTNTNNAVYVTRQGSSQEIKRIIGAHEEVYGRFFDENVRTYRPWGYYEVLVNAPHYKVKKIVVFPGKRLSLQRHFYRSEHWTIAKGTATITLGEETCDYTANRSTYIPIGVLHRLENGTNEALEVIEVSLGEVLSEDDIERVQDDFAR